MPSAVSRLRSQLLQKRLRRRRDDAERRAVRQDDSGRPGQSSLRRSVRSDRSAPSSVEHLALRHHAVGAHCVAPPTSMYSMNRTSALTVRAELDQLHQFIVVDAADDHGVDLQAAETARWR